MEQAIGKEPNERAGPVGRSSSTAFAFVIVDSKKGCVDAIIQTVNIKRVASQESAAHKKKNRDRRVLGLSLDFVSAENQRATRALSQALLAGELQEAIMLCMKSGLLMPLATLLRSLIDTSVLGLWLLKYATKEEVRDSVAHLSTVEMVRHSFREEDRTVFTFLFQQVKGTDHEFYRDVLHPSIHGDALHLAMRIRDQTSKQTWVYFCLFHTHPCIRSYTFTVC